MKLFNLTSVTQLMYIPKQFYKYR